MNKDDEKYLSNVIEETKNIMTRFFKKMGLDNMFNHLFDIRIIIDYDKKYTNDDITGLYSLDANIINDEEDEKETDADLESSPKYEKIFINPEYFNDCKKSNKSDKLILTLIHEFIHKNRSLLVKSENTDVNYYYIDRSIHFNKEFESKYDINTLKKVLDDYISNHDKCIGRILLCSARGNDSYKIYYDFNTKFFEVLDDNNIIISRYDDKLSLNYEDRVNLASDFYTIKDDNGNKIFDNINDMYNFIEYQHSMEEALTETCANIIYLSKDKANFDLNECCDELLNLNRYDIKACALLFKTYGMELFNWFILSTYDDEYINKFSDIFKDDYINIIGLFDTLYKYNNEDAYDGIVDLIKSNKLKR